MIRQSINRSQSTRGGLATSFGLHAAILLLLVIVAQRAADVPEAEELTRISYIEATYGEDVAKKVRIKTAPKPSPDPPGKGISTESLAKKDSASEKAPEPKAPTPTRRTSQQELAAAPKLESREPVRNTPMELPGRVELSSKDVAEISAPYVPPTKRRESFMPNDAALKSRGKSLAVADADIAGSSLKSTPGSKLATDDGPALKSRSGGTSGGTSSYAPPTSGLRSRGGGKGIADATGSPNPGRSSSEKGRRTILDYGQGGGGLKGKGGGLAEAPSAVVKPKASSPKAQIADTAADQIDANGMKMTISGQIKGRKILESVPPQYTDRARREGWEGVVGVHFTVMPDGRVKDNMYLEQTSMHRDLNQAAMRAIKKFRFAPLPGNQPQVEQWGVITIVFRLS